MSVIAARRCVQHVEREAVARCPSCAEYFCRECVIEHDGELLCSPCLAIRAVAKSEPRKSGFGAAAMDFLLTVSCVMFLWLVFYGFGQVLQAIPAEVHEGTIWRIDP